MRTAVLWLFSIELSMYLLFYIFSAWYVFRLAKENKTAKKKLLRQVCQNGYIFSKMGSSLVMEMASDLWNRMQIVLILLFVLIMLLKRQEIGL